MTVVCLEGDALAARWLVEMGRQLRKPLPAGAMRDVTQTVAGRECFGFEDNDSFMVCSVGLGTLFVDYVAGANLRHKMLWLKGLALAADCRWVQARACTPARGRLFRRLGFQPCWGFTDIWECEVGNGR